MYTIEFYEKANGESDVWEFLEKLRQEAPAKKDSRIQYKQAVFYIQLLNQSVMITYPERRLKIYENLG